jgi:hypothetical protein
MTFAGARSLGASIFSPDCFFVQQLLQRNTVNLIQGDRADATLAGDDSNFTTRLMVQIPDSFDPTNSCVVAAPSSGSRGVYGAIATAGEWGLKHGCAVAYTNKGTADVALSRPIAGLHGRSHGCRRGYPGWPSYDRCRLVASGGIDRWPFARHSLHSTKCPPRLCTGLRFRAYRNCRAE